MALKLFVSFTLLVVIVSALPTDYSHLQGIHGDIHSAGYETQAGDNGHYEEENYGPVEYEFKYGVHDTHTGDIKSQEEVRKGDVVHGRYELIDADGYRRIVEYTADDHNGFQAVVRREPTDIKIPVPEPQHYAVPEQSYSGKGVYFVSSTAAPLAHYSSSGYDSSSLGYGSDDEQDDGLSGKYHH